MENTIQPQGGGAGVPVPSPSIDPNEYAQMQARLSELENYQLESQEVFNQLQPHSARIKRLIEDETAQRIFDDSLSAYESMQQRNKPKLSDEWNPEVNPYLQKLEKVYDVVNNFEQKASQYEQVQQNEANQRLLAENTKLSEQLIEKFPHLAEQNYAGISMIAAYGLQNKMSFSDAARALEPVYRRETAEPTLRPELGAPGIPGNSTKDGEVDMVQRAAELIREQQRKAGMTK
jgi:hypothetical protein